LIFSIEAKEKLWEIHQKLDLERKLLFALNYK